MTTVPQRHTGQVDRRTDIILNSITRTLCYCTHVAGKTCDKHFCTVCKAF